MRLIDADAITEKQIAHYLGIKFASCTEDVVDLIKDQSTVSDANKDIEIRDLLFKLHLSNEERNGLDRALTEACKIIGYKLKVCMLDAEASCPTDNCITCWKLHLLHGADSKDIESVKINNKENTDETN